MFLSIQRNTKLGLVDRSVWTKALNVRKNCFCQRPSRSDYALRKYQLMRNYTKGDSSDSQFHQCVLYRVRVV